MGQVSYYWLFWIIRHYLYWPKFLQVIFCYCSSTLAVQLIRGVFHSISWFRVIRVLFLCCLESLWLKKFVEYETQGQEIPQKLMYRYKLRPFWTWPWDLPISLMNDFSGKKQNFWYWDYSPQMPDYQDFWIIRHQIKEILLYMHLPVYMHVDSSLLRYFVYCTL